MTDEEKEKYQKLFSKALDLFRNPPKTHCAAYYIGLIMERRAREGKDPYGWREDWEKTLKEFHVNEKKKEE